MSVLLKNLKRFQRLIKQSLNEDLITVYAAQASFYMAIASLPFLMLLLAAMQLLLLNRASDLLVSVQPYLPNSLYGIIEQIFNTLNQRANGVIPVSAVTAVWTASRGVAAISRGVRRVYKTDTPSFWGLFVKDSLNTLLLVLVILFSLIMLAFGAAISTFLATFLAIDSVGIFTFSRIVLFMLMLTLLFTFIYRMISGKAMPFVKHIPGAAFSAFGWVIFSLLYEFYTQNFANYSYIYGSLTAIVLLMLWLYFCMIIFLFGAKINKLLENRRPLRFRDNA